MIPLKYKDIFRYYTIKYIQIGSYLLFRENTTLLLTYIVHVAGDEVLRHIAWYILNLQYLLFLFYVGLT